MPDQQAILTVLEALDSGIILLGVDGRVVFWNEWLVAASGISSTNANGELLAELFPNAPLGRLLGAVASALESGVSGLLTHALRPHLFPLKTRTGKTLVHDVVVRAIGQPFKYCLIQISDVTVSTERDVVLRKRQNARYDAVVASAPDVILTIDADGNIQLANPAAVSQFGYPQQELVGQPASMLFRDASAWTDMWRSAMNGERVQQAVEIAALKKGGAVSYLEVSLSRWRSDMRFFVSAILRDVNERREIAETLRNLNATLELRVTQRTDQLMQAEEALRQSQKMEAVGQLTGGIAHDFNNLLQGIIGSLERVQTRIGEGRIGDVDKFLQGALTSANRAAALTHRLLAFSRRQPVDPRPLDVGQLVGTIEELLRRSIGELVALKVICENSLWLVRCDSNQLENALLNLSINARDAMPDGGLLNIEVANVVLNESQARERELVAGDYVRLLVRDSGVGMPPDVKSRAFDPFYTTKAIGQGTGLGLSMVYGFVRQSDGAIKIESETGKGTTIEIVFPRFSGELELISISEHAPRPRSDQASEVVLVVEDENVVRLLVVEVLKDLGYHSLEAADGRAALRILQSSQRVDLLVTDIGLPELNGRQLADAARLKRPELKILFMTGYAEKAASSSFLEQGMDIIIKPFTTNALASRIREIIGTRSAADKVIGD
jgi:PAS domain S-box-containing protein